MELTPEVAPQKQEQLPFIEASPSEAEVAPPTVSAAPVPPTQAAISDAIAQANSAKSARVAEMMARPGVESQPEAEKILAAGDRRAWYANLLPERLRPHVGIDVEGQRHVGVEKAYVTLVDNKADALLAVRARALTDLKTVNLGEPAHLLPSKQYRAAEALTRSDQALRALRPLSTLAYHDAVAAQRAEPTISAPPPARVQAQQSREIDQSAPSRAMGLQRPTPGLPAVAVAKNGHHVKPPSQDISAGFGR